MRRKTYLIFLLMLLVTIPLAGCAGENQLSAPGVTLTVNPTGNAKEVSSGVQLLVLLTILSLAPSILIMTTSFARIIIVLSLLRNAIGTPQVPPNQVIVGLALIMTFFIMTPVYNQVDQLAIQPYLSGQLDQTSAFQKAAGPVRDFMFKQTREKDLELFLSMSGKDRPSSLDDISTVVLLPAFVLSELRTAFVMGFAIYVPFLIIDLVVSSILLAMGMMMLPPSLVSLPFKILLFVMVDGWYLIARSLSMSFIK
jgi:flagellar biosynthetic protein FliP